MYFLSGVDNITNAPRRMAYGQAVSRLKTVENTAYR
jgi:hypothetical protein